MDKQLQSLLVMMHERKASDLHIVANQPLYFRINGILYPMKGSGYSSEDVGKMIRSILSDEKWQEFLKTGDMDLAVTLPARNEHENPVRYRFNLYMERGNFSISVRRIENHIPPFEELGLPRNLPEFLPASGGLFLVTGPTGSGKSTTIASIIDWLNHNRRLHIVTIEDPIEFYFESDRSLISQREVGSDTESFAVALKQALRQDPDVIVIGEMRDFESTRWALTAAETGHLVLATLHSRDALQTINRIIDIFPAEFQQQVRTQLATSLIAIFSQRLLVSSRTQQHVLALEILYNTQAVKTNIRRNELQVLKSFMESERPMQTLNQDIVRLYVQRKIDKDTVLQYMDEEEFLRHYGRIRNMMK